MRELENTVAPMLALSDGDSVGLEVLSRSSAEPAASAVAAQSDVPLRDRVQSFERDAIERALSECSNQSEAARKLGITRASLFDKCKRYGGTFGARAR